MHEFLEKLRAKVLGSLKVPQESHSKKSLLDEYHEYVNYQALGGKLEYKEWVRAGKPDPDIWFG